MTSDGDAAADSAPGPPNAEGGGVIRLGSHLISAPDGGSPLVMEFEARVATGQQDQQLALEQAAAIRQVLAWIARNRHLNNDGHDPIDC